MPVVVPHSNSTSNHNIIGVAAVRPKVVSHSNSTSNHNISLEEARLELLFLITILHQKSQRLVISYIQNYVTNM